MRPTRATTCSPPSPRPNRDVVVVTADRELAERVRAANAEVVGPNCSSPSSSTEPAEPAGARGIRTVPAPGVGGQPLGVCAAWGGLVDVSARSPVPSWLRS